MNQQMNLTLLLAGAARQSGVLLWLEVLLLKVLVTWLLAGPSDPQNIPALLGSLLEKMDDKEAVPYC